MKIGFGMKDLEYPTITFKPLDHNAGFVLNVEGRKVVALKLPSVESSGLGPLLLSSILKRFKDTAERNNGTRLQWLVWTGTEGAVMDEYDRFAVLVARWLTKGEQCKSHDVGSDLKG